MPANSEWGRAPKHTRREIGSGQDREQDRHSHHQEYTGHPELEVPTANVIGAHVPLPPSWVRAGAYRRNRDRQAASRFGGSPANGAAQGGRHQLRPRAARFREAVPDAAARPLVPPPATALPPCSARPTRHSTCRSTRPSGQSSHPGPTGASPISCRPAQLLPWTRRRLATRHRRDRSGRAPSALDRPPLTSAPPWRSSCLREIDPRSRRSSTSEISHRRPESEALRR